MNAPVEDKVKASTVASAASGVAVWALSTYVFHDAVPEAVAATVAVVVPAVVTFVTGWLSKHTVRTPPGR